MTKAVVETNGTGMPTATVKVSAKPAAAAAAAAPSARCLVETRLPTDHGNFRIRLYENDHDRKDHVALIAGDVVGAAQRGEPIRVRMHSECLTGDIFHSRRCDCGEQLRAAMRHVAERGLGVILLLRQEGRGIGLLDKLRAYNLQDAGHDTVESNLRLGHQADERDYTAAALILAEMGIHHVELLTNNPAKVEQLRALGVSRVDRVPLEAVGICEDNYAYLRTKVVRMNHQISNLAEFAQRNGHSDDELLLSASSSFSSLPLPPTPAPTPTPSAMPMNASSAASSPRVNGIDMTAHKAVTVLPAPPSVRRVAVNVDSAEGAMEADLSAFLPSAAPSAPSRPRRPRVTLCYAQCLDGAMSAAGGAPLAISGAASSVLTHRLRASHDAILVGINTVLADNPRLTARLPPTSSAVAVHQPRPVVLDALLRTPINAALLTGDRKPILVCGPQAPADRRAVLEAAGVTIVQVDTAAHTAASNAVDMLDLPAALAALADRHGIASLMVEGGPTVLASFVRGGLADAVVVTIAPQFAFNGAAAVVRMPPMRMDDVMQHRFGDDVVVVGRPGVVQE